MTTRPTSVTEFAWTPSAEQARDTNVMRFAGRHGLDDYWALVRRSQDDPEWFWASVVDYLGIEFAKPFEQVLDDSRGIEWAAWFVGGQLNMAWNCVGKWASRTPAALAVIGETEDGQATQLTYSELWRDTCHLAVRTPFARRGARRSSRAVSADGRRGSRRASCLHARGRRRRSDLLGPRSAGCSGPAGRRRGEGGAYCGRDAPSR